MSRSTGSSAPSSARSEGDFGIGGEGKGEKDLMAMRNVLLLHGDRG